MQMQIIPNYIEKRFTSLTFMVTKACLFACHRKSIEKMLFNSLDFFGHLKISSLAYPSMATKKDLEPRTAWGFFLPISRVHCKEKLSKQQFVSSWIYRQLTMMFCVRHTTGVEAFTKNWKRSTRAIQKEDIVFLQQQYAA